MIISAAVFDLIKSSKPRWFNYKLGFCCLFLVFIVVTSLQLNLFWHTALAAERYDSMAIATYLNTLPNTTKIYLDSSYGDIPIYMDFRNTSRFYFDYQGITNCRNISANSYVVTPRSYDDGFNYTHNPLINCSYWILKLEPQYPNLSPNISEISSGLDKNLYYVP